MKKILVVSDMHCGSLNGLTPPSWMISSKRNKRISKLQEEMWGCYTDWVKEIGSVDLLVCNGDLIDGKARKNGGVELLTTDMISQTDIALECLDEVKYKDALFTYGTSYHVSNSAGDDYERIIADHCKGTIDSRLRFNIEGVKFDVRHHVSSSSVPNGRFSAIAKNRFWDIITAEKSQGDPSNVYIRSHVHYYNYCGGADWCAFCTPALQSPGTDYGARICVGDTDFGLMLFTVDDGLLTGWTLKTKNLDNVNRDVIYID